jgi:hypothetical protein
MFSGMPITNTVTVSPLISTCYTVVGASMGCFASAAQCVLVNLPPTISITPSGSICAGDSYTISANGAASYLWTTGATTSSIVVSPSVSTCYTVLGTSASGCMGASTACVNVFSGPALSIGGGNTVCLGSSITLTATGGTGYLWSTGATSNTINVLPASTANYSVSSQGSNGCTGHANISVGVDSSCAQVWPGDANSDGIVGTSDVLELGLAFNNTGTPRSPGGNNYVSQYAHTWTGTVSSGKNKCHADCNGDGVINHADTVAIFNNFSMTHSFKAPYASSANASFYFQSANNFAYPGTWNKVNLMLGDASSPAMLLYGVTFDVAFDPSLIENNSVYINYTPSFLNASNQNIEFRKTDFAPGKIYCASVRTNASNVSGYGKIAEVYFKLKSSVTDHTPVEISLTNARQIDNLGFSTVLGTAATTLTVNLEAGVTENTAQEKINMYPNPAGDALMLTTGHSTPVNFTIIDLVGRELLKGTIINSKSLDISGYENGTYFIRFADGRSISNQKLVISK